VAAGGGCSGEWAVCGVFNNSCAAAATQAPQLAQLTVQGGPARAITDQACARPQNVTPKIPTQSLNAMALGARAAAKAKDADDAKFRAQVEVILL